MVLYLKKIYSHIRENILKNIIIEIEEDICVLLLEYLKDFLDISLKLYR